MKDIMVSILCLAYNHEKYIGQALESFINQKTNFKYEVIINDDCSTDNTTNIIKYYANKYPDIIKPIYQTENQYSKGVQIINEILIPNACGKYFAFCEGDDYFVDNYKLQKQFDFLESNREYMFCVHNSLHVDNNNNIVGKTEIVKKDCDLNCENFIIGGGGFVSTNSIFAPLELTKKIPDYLREYSIDYLWQIYLSSQGKTRCFNEKMTAYRVNVKNSWRDQMIKSNDKYVKHLDKIVEKLEKFDISNNYKYHDVVEEKIQKIKFKIFVLEKNYTKIKEEPYRSYVKQMTLKAKIKILYGFLNNKLLDKKKGVNK